METSLTSRVTPLREPNPELLRTPPYNAEAEQALLGAMLINNSAYLRVSEFLQSEHFGNAMHGRIFAAVGKLVERGQIANPVTLKNLFDQDGALTEIGGAQYLARLASAAATIINAEDYGRAIYDLHIRRELITLGEDVVNDAFRQDLEDSAREQIERAEKKLFDLATTGQAEGGFRVFSATLTSAINNAEAAFKRNGKTVGVATGFLDLDRKLGGLHRSDLVILAGRPSMGKTALATNIAFNAAKAYKAGRTPDGHNIAEDGAVVGFFSLEMSAEQLATRILAEESVYPSEPTPCQNSSVYRRHAGADRLRVTHARAAAEAPTGARAHRRRLSSASAPLHPRSRDRKQGAGDFGHYPLVESACEGARCSGACALATVARRRAA
jgi:replicative DNA helicase